MARWHYCPKHPELDDADPWAPGPTSDCKYHPKVDTGTARPLRYSTKQRRKEDARKGVVGTDRGGYIHGH